MPIFYPSIQSVKQFTANLAQAAATYDLATVTGGDLMLTKSSIYVVTAGATFTSAAIATNQTSVTNIMTAVEGAVANLIAQKLIPIANANFPILLRSGQKIQYIIVGVTGTGSLLCTFEYNSITGGVLA